MTDLPASNDKAMNGDRPHQTRTHDSQDNSVRDNTAPVQTTRIEVSDRTMSVIALVLAAAAIMGIFWAISEAGRAEREARLLQLKYDDMRVALELKGIDPNQHTKGQSP